jgi:hypothetical protein
MSDLGKLLLFIGALIANPRQHPAFAHSVLDHEIQEIKDNGQPPHGFTESSKRGVNGRRSVVSNP